MMASGEDAARRERKLRQLRAAIADHEDEFGHISVDEIVARRRADKRDATVVRGGVSG